MREEGTEIHITLPKTTDRLDHPFGLKAIALRVKLFRSRFCSFESSRGSGISWELAREGCETTDRCGYDRASFIGERWVITEVEVLQVGEG